VTFSAGANGGFEETLFLHEREKALIVADLLLYLDDDQLPTALNKMMTQVGRPLVIYQSWCNTWSFPSVCPVFCFSWWGFGSGVSGLVYNFRTGGVARSHLTKCFVLFENSF
jgi:hypothetical protein